MSATAESSRSRTYFARNCQPVWLGGMGSDERQAAEVLHLRQRGHALEQPRDDRRGDAEVLAAAHDAQEHLVRRRRERDHDLLDLVARNRVVQIPARARRPERRARRTCRREAPCRGTRPAGKPSSGLSRKRLATRAPTRPAPTMSVGRTLSRLDASPLVRPVPREAPRADVREGESPQPHGLGRQVGGGAEQDAAVRTIIAASVVATRIVRRSSSVWSRNRSRYRPRDQ